MSESSKKPSTGSRGKLITAVVLVIIVVVVAAAYLLAIKGPSTEVVNMPSGVGSVQSLNFNPSTITVVVGVNNTIKWVNQDSTAHTVTSTSVPGGANSFDSGTINPGLTYALTLTVPGTYQYHCTIHPAWMIATIIVKAS